MTKDQEIQSIKQEWAKPRWVGIVRNYSPEDVYKIRGSVRPEYTLAGNRLTVSKEWGVD